MTDERGGAAPDGVLSGVRVLEMANWVAAPNCGALMADLGAEVIKVEPPGGDPYRHYAQRSQEYEYDFPRNMAFQLDNRGKRSLTVNLGHGDAPGLIHRLLGSVDVFLSNLLPHRRRRYGLTSEAMLAAHPRLIDLSLTGYGSAGPDADMPGYDQSAYWARPGIMALMGEPAGPPALQRGAMGDHTAALGLLAAVLAALRQRERTGKGQRVEMSLLATGMWLLGTDLAQALADGRQPERHDRAAPANPLRNVYPTAEGRWLQLAMPDPDPYWPALCRALEAPEWAEDSRYATAEGRARHGAALAGAIEARLRQRPLEEWGPRLDAHGIVWAPVAGLPEVVNDPQAEAAERFAPVHHPAIGDFRTVAAPFALGEASPQPRAAAPEPGADTRAVLRELGIDDAEVERLGAAGVIALPAE